MSHFINTSPCPVCREKGEDTSGDNLANYSDHSYCFKCGYTIKGDIVLKYFSPLVNKEGLTYPEECDFSKACIDYLYSFGLTNEEIFYNFKGHEDGYMFFDSNFFLVRRLYKNPKVIIKGNVVGNEPVFLKEGNTVVLVEDIISAVKVGRVINTCALLKTAIHDTLLYRLSNQFENCFLWLDADMYEHMTNKLLPKIKPFFKECKIIFTEKDPKYYDTEEIRRILDL